MNAFITPFITPHNRANLSRPALSRHPSTIVAPSPRAARMCASTTTSLETFLRAAGDLGTLRFITISDGAVLETIGRLDYDIKNFTIPNKGDYLTIASVDTTFECHINLSKVANVTVTTEKAKMGDHQLHVIRLLGEKDKIVLSMLLQWDPSVGPGNYLHGAEATFEKLQNRFGTRFTV